MMKDSTKEGKYLSARSQSISSAESSVAHAELCYWPSILVLLTLGLANLLFAKFDGLIGSTLALINAIIMFEWTSLHSGKLTRRERPFYDEMNILATSENFEFNHGPLLDDLTPGGGQCCGAYPNASLLAKLFKDERDEEMQKFYQSHYGQMYTTAKRVEAEHKATENASKKN